jgi:FtsP/CotA-like multicopper oxidase with cupredoxin domain
MTFTDYADPTMPYMYHCHLLRHEDQGMMGQFVVVEEGQQPDLGAHPH